LTAGRRGVRSRQREGERRVARSGTGALPGADAVAQDARGLAPTVVLRALRGGARFGADRGQTLRRAVDLIEAVAKEPQHLPLGHEIVLARRDARIASDLERLARDAVAAREADLIASGNDGDRVRAGAQVPDP